MVTNIKPKHAYEIISNCIYQLQQRQKDLYELLDRLVDSSHTNDGHITLVKEEIDKCYKTIKFLKKGKI